MKSLVVFGLLACFAFCTNVYGQQTAARKLDSLNNAIKDLVDTDPELMFVCASQQSKLATEVKDTRALAGSCIAFGRYYWYAVNFPLALQYYNRAFVLAQSGNERQLAARAQTGMGTVYLWEQNFQAAMQKFMAAHELADSMHNDSLLSDCFIDFGLFYRWDGNPELNYQKALAYYHQAADIKRQIKDTSGLARVYNCIGSVYLDQHKVSHALDTTLLALQMVNISGDKYRKAKICKSLAYIYFELNDYDLAEKYGNASLQLYGETAIFEGLTDANEILSKVYERTGRHKEALERYKAYAQANDRLNSKINNRLLTEMQMKAEQGRKDLIVANRLLRERQFSVAAAIISCLLLVLVVVAIRAYQSKKADNITIGKLVNEQEKTIEKRTVQLAEANKSLTHSNEKLLELIQYNAHNLREPLTRIMGAMNLRDDMEPTEFEEEIWPQMEKAVTDLDNSIRDVIRIADETVGQCPIN